MFGTIRRHQKWLWIVISTVTIISFVAFFSPQRRRQAGWTGPRDVVGSINGEPVTRDRYASAYREAELRYLFSYGDWPGNDAMSRQGGIIEREARNRLFLLHKIDELGIEVSEAAAAQWIVEAFRDRNDKGFRRDAYEQFLRNALPMRGLTPQDFERFARHEVAIQHIIALAGSAGKLITPQEAESLFRRENEEREAVCAFVSSSNYLSQVTVDPNAVATYYTNNQATYRIPEKLQITYVRFPASNFLAQAEAELAKNTNVNRLVEATYLQKGTNTYLDANNTPLPPDAAKAKIRDEFKHSLALDEARKKAIEFANELFEQRTNTLENLAAAKSLVVGVTDPFTQFETPRDLKVPSSFSQTVARLTSEEPFAEQPVVGEDAVYIVALKQRIPSELPPLESIVDRVTQDYQKSKALASARAAGEQLHSAVTNSLAQGKPFETAVTETNAVPVAIGPFSRKTTALPGVPPAEVSQVIRTAFNVQPGHASNFTPTRSGGYVLFVKNVVPVPDEKVKAELPEFTKNLRQSRQYEAFSEWFQKQLEAARIVLPGDKQERASAQ